MESFIHLYPPLMLAHMLKAKPKGPLRHPEANLLRPLYYYEVFWVGGMRVPAYRRELFFTFEPVGVYVYEPRKERVCGYVIYFLYDKGRARDGVCDTERPRESLGKGGLPRTEVALECEDGGGARGAGYCVKRREHAFGQLGGICLTVGYELHRGILACHRKWDMYGYGYGYGYALVHASHAKASCSGWVECNERVLGRVVLSRGRYRAPILDDTVRKCEPFLAR